jgi:hypothetical protein
MNVSDIARVLTANLLRIAPVDPTSFVVESFHGGEQSPEQFAVVVKAKLSLPWTPDPDGVHTFSEGTLLQIRVSV